MTMTIPTSKTKTKAAPKTARGKNAKDIADEAIAQAKGTSKEATVTIQAPDIRVAVFRLRGNAPYVQNRFANKAEIMMKQAEGSTAKKGKAKAAKDFEANYRAAMHVCTYDEKTIARLGLTPKEAQETWIGIPAPAFRSGLISACRLSSFKMTLAKLSLFILADGLDQDGCPCVRIEGTPERHDGHVRNATGVIDIRSRPMFRQWETTLRIRYDAAQFTVSDVANLLMRVGEQVGVGEGRPDSKSSAGMGWGTFDIVE